MCCKTYNYFEYYCGQPIEESMPKVVGIDFFNAA